MLKILKDDEFELVINYDPGVILSDLLSEYISNVSLNDYKFKNTKLYTLEYVDDKGYHHLYISENYPTGKYVDILGQMEIKYIKFNEIHLDFHYVSDDGSHSYRIDAYIHCIVLPLLRGIKYIPDDIFTDISIKFSS